MWTYTHIYIHTYIHTYTRTYIHTSSCHKEYFGSRPCIQVDDNAATTSKRYVHCDSCFVIFLALWLWHTSFTTTLTECCGILVAVPAWRNLLFHLYATLSRNLNLPQFYVYFVSWSCIHIHDNATTTSKRYVLCDSCFVIFSTLWLWHTCYCMIVAYMLLYHA